MRNSRKLVVARNLMGRVASKRITFAELIKEGLDFDRDALLNRLDLGYLLPVKGATTAQNQSMADATYFPRSLMVTTDQAINQGDAVWWDEIHFTLKPLTLASQVPYVAGTGSGGYCGLAGGTTPPNVYPNPIGASGPSEALPGIEVQHGGTARMNSTAGEGSYSPFQLVTIGATSQTVTRVGATASNALGYIVVPPPVFAAAAAGATPVPGNSTPSGGSVELWIAPKFPVGIL